MKNCPTCHSANVRRSRPRTKWESCRKAITPKRLYRCRNCDWRGWGVDSAAIAKLDVVSRAPAPEPNLKKGTALAHIEWRRRLDLEALDEPASHANLKAPRRS